jgi:alpha-beta hydrolase superfamily lysophospholipase
MTAAQRHRGPPTFAVRLGIAAAVTGTLLAGGSTALHHEERHLTFEAIRDAASWFNELPKGVQEFALPVRTGEGAQNIYAWWWPAADPHAPVLLYLHGSRANLTDQVDRLQQLRDFGFSVFAIDYRGFGRSDGDLPSEQTVYEDARTAWDWLAERQPDPAKRFIYGHSLGGAVAVDLAAALSGSDADTAPAGRTSPAGGLIVESSFTTLVDIAKEWSFPWLPLGSLMSQKFDSVSKIGRIAMPVLIVHGAIDHDVPSRFGQALYAAATGRKKLLLIEGGGHSDSMGAGAAQYRQALAELFGLGASAQTATHACRSNKTESSSSCGRYPNASSAAPTRRDATSSANARSNS